VLKKAIRKSTEVVDVRADEPERAMEQFTNALRRVLMVPTTVIASTTRRTKKRRDV